MKIKIDKLGIDGEGVGRITSGENLNKVCFVDFLLPNEVADVEIYKTSSRFVRAKISKIEKMSTDRVEPKCPYFKVCGGCDLQHMNKHMQLDFKKNLVKETIQKIAKIDVEVSDVVRLNDYNYRNKMAFPIYLNDGKIVVGMFKANSHKIVEIKECLIADKNINLILKNAQEFFEKVDTKEYKFLRYMVIRAKDNNAIITFVVSRKIDLSKYYANLKKLPIKCGLSIIIGNDENNILSGKYFEIGGKNMLDFDEFGVNYCVDNLGFLQVNNTLKMHLYDEILNYVNQDEVLVDGYCGAGLLTAVLAKKCSKAIGVDIVKSSIASAKQLIQKNSISNVEFYLGDFKLILPNLLKDNLKYTIVLDPPRQGCSMEVLNLILDNAVSINKIIYVSCNPATLARDLGLLKQSYRISKVIPMDMFPQTRHVETLVVLEKII